MGSRRCEEEHAIDLIEDIEPAETEHDVERVLRKQDTHDLYCPNCHSCINRRVVLRKRRRDVPKYRPTVVIAPSETTLEPARMSVPVSGVIDILKSIVYGGLTESLASLVVVASAAGGGAATSTTLALALANLIGGLFILGNKLMELKNSRAESETDVEEDHYHEQLGRREHFCLHATIVVLSFLVFGSVAPITYWFSFRKSDDREYKLAVVASASLVCIFLLALAKARVKKPPKSYIRTVLYYLMLGLTSSVISFFVGDLVDKLLARVDLFEPGSNSTSVPSVPKKMMAPSRLGWNSY